MAERHRSVDFPTLLIADETSLMGISSPHYQDPYTFALLSEIVKRESGGDPTVCNRQYGCIAGMGLVGFISGTWNSTIERMKEEGAYLPSECDEKVVLPVSDERAEAVFDPECNLLVGEWLLETDGIVHWEAYSGPYGVEAAPKVVAVQDVKIDTIMNTEILNQEDGEETPATAPEGTPEDGGADGGESPAEPTEGGEEGTPSETPAE